MGVLYASGSMPLILPIPYIAPWISFTESEACKTFGEYIVGLVTPQVETEQMISELRSGDIVLLKLKKGESHKVTITHINDKFVVGHREYQPGHSTGISFNREDVIDVKILKEHKSLLKTAHSSRVIPPSLSTTTSIVRPLDERDATSTSL